MTISATQTSASPAAKHAWAEHLIWMEGGEPVEVRAKESVWPGIALVCLIAATAFGLQRVFENAGVGAARLLDPVLLSMLLGLAWGNLVARDVFLPGISASVRKLLPLGIVLLGARMDFLEALRIGVPGLGLSVLVVIVAIGLLVALGRWLGLDRNLAILLGVGTGICGGTAIVAIAPILKAKDRDVLVGVGLVTLIGLGAMIILPGLARVLDLSQNQFGLLAGLTIHQTPQVIAAGFAYGEEAGQVATVAKLARVCLLAPVAVGLGWWISRREEGNFGTGISGKRRPWYRLLPAFAVGFLALAAMRTLGLLPEVELGWNGLFGKRDVDVTFDTTSILKIASSFLLAAGMVGVGYQTRLYQGRDLGWRPIAAACLASLLIGALVLVFVKLSFS